MLYPLFREHYGMPEAFAEWTTAFVNDLPDSSFLYIAPGGEKDEDDRTAPRSLRYFPVKNAEGDLDLPHLRNAIARIPQSKAPGLTPDKMQALQGKARAMLDTEKQESAEEVDPLEGPEQSYSDWSWAVRLSDGGAKWVELARSGAHFGRGSDRRVDLSGQDIESMANGYKKIQSEKWFPTGAPVGYNHATVSGAVDPESTKAAGRILDVRVEDNGEGVSLMGLIQWTDEARRRIHAGEFDGFSIEAIPVSAARSKKTGEPLGEWALVGGTLTNEPFVAGLSKVAASETRNSSMSLTKLLSDTLSLAECATDAHLVAKVQALSELAGKAEALTEALSSVTEDRDTIKTELDELREKETERLLDRACEDGRIAQSERDRYHRILVKLGEEEASYAYPKNRIPVAEVGKPGVDSERVATDAAGIEAEAKALAEGFVNDLGLDEATAYGRAISMVLSNPTKLAAYEAESVNS